MNPKYTIIIPTYNRAYSLWRAIQSVVSQTYINWLLYVVDGGSTDGTERLVNEFQDHRITFLPNPHDTGVASARNFALTQVTTDYVGYLDSDDVVYPHWLEVMDQHIQENPDKVLFMPNKLHTMRQIDENFRTIQIFKQGILHDQPYTPQRVVNLSCENDTNGLIHQTATINTVGLWNEELPLYEDYEFMLRFVEKHPNGFHFVPQVLGEYTRTYGKDSLCSGATYQELVDCLKTVYRMHGHKPFMKSQRWYPALVEKYQDRAEQEKRGETSILTHLVEKYGRKKQSTPN